MINDLVELKIFFFVKMTIQPTAAKEGCSFLVDFSGDYLLRMHT